MAVIFYKVDEEVLDVAREMMEAYHPELRTARIGFVFRSEPGTTHGNKILGAASRPNASIFPFAELDFLIWLSKPDWDAFSPDHRRALVDHELMHCTRGDSGWSMRGHDIEEFYDIIRRHGFWKRDLRYLAEVVQGQLPGIGVPVVEEKGAVIAVDVRSMQEDPA